MTRNTQGLYRGVQTTHEPIPPQIGGAFTNGELVAMLQDGRTAHADVEQAERQDRELKYVIGRRIVSAIIQTLMAMPGVKLSNMLVDRPAQLPITNNWQVDIRTEEISDDALEAMRAKGWLVTNKEVEPATEKMLHDRDKVIVTVNPIELLQEFPNEVDFNQETAHPVLTRYLLDERGKASDAFSRMEAHIENVDTRIAHQAYKLLIQKIRELLPDQAAQILQNASFDPSEARITRRRIGDDHNCEVATFLVSYFPTKIDRGEGLEYTLQVLASTLTKAGLNWEVRGTNGEQQSVSFFHIPLQDLMPALQEDEQTI